ncbi:sarcosine dehydrogenase, mitochondrial [Drosophila sulfurigaster albostrigata]|uniref:sarcosine dehydrogenase, mitochondrial n=1 Tax=Drosophila sulfurigaster albostrigata TaxID=89887 RepID=UPI002D21C052|nr:sarcosine dehydrogenase, mitochondrial [Drosophila sulfurigaster albostrigata]
MWRTGIVQQATRQDLRRLLNRNNSSKTTAAATATQLPQSADVVVIGGGSAGCHTLYHLAKQGVRAVLLERAQLTAGTTWHTAGLLWRLRPSDVDIQLLANSRNMLRQLEAETGLDPGWIQNGGIFIAHNETRLDEYRRLATVGSALGIENQILSPEETQKLFPLLDPKAFIGALYSPGDGVMDPAMLCTALRRAATANGAQVIENCDVQEILVEQGSRGKKVVGVSTPFGNIRTETVVNATGVWGRDLVARHGTHLPLLPMKHAYIVSESIPGVRGLPNIRDHDYSTYFRIQGDAICMGGYEPNPILLDPVAKDFHFGLYELDWSVFETHVEGAHKLCPEYAKYGVKSTVCGPESFTPDHKPLMGPDPNVSGLMHNCGFNSAGMMFGGGCGEQMALWITKGQPDVPMFSFDLRRFTQEQGQATKWIAEKSHESYVKNYSMVFKFDQPLAGRDFQLDPLHEQMLEANAFMEEKQGWERPGFFLGNKEKSAAVLPYDWYGSYEHARHKESNYERILEGDLKYNSFSEHHELIGAEAHACRNNAVLFNMSYFAKLVLEGPQAHKAADWLFSANTKRDPSKTVYTCALNDAGGVEADVTISRLVSGSGQLHDPKFEGKGYYIVAGGASAYYTYSTLLAEMRRKGFNAKLHDVAADLGVISIQGPNSRSILQPLLDCELTDEQLPPNSTTLAKLNGIGLRVLRVSFVGELGYELHVPKQDCVAVYKALKAAGAAQDLRDAGYRALYSLSSEKGYHLWSYDLRSDDTPLEAGLGFTCRKQGDYRGRAAVDRQRSEGLKRRMVYLTLQDQVPIWGLEGVYRNGKPVGVLRRAEYAYTLGKSLGQAYITRSDGQNIDAEYLKAGDYEVDILGKRYKANCHLRSPFDPSGQRVLGNYETNSK